MEGQDSFRSFLRFCNRCKPLFSAPLGLKTSLDAVSQTVASHSEREVGFGEFKQAFAGAPPPRLFDTASRLKLL
jgi:hypothetical protein